MRLIFVGKGFEDFTRRSLVFFEIGKFVQLRSGHGEVALRVVFYGCLVEYRVKEEAEKGERDNVRRGMTQGSEFQLEFVPPQLRQNSIVRGFVWRRGLQPYKVYSVPGLHALKYLR